MVLLQNPMHLPGSFSAAVTKAAVNRTVCSQRHSLWRLCLQCMGPGTPCRAENSVHEMCECSQLLTISTEKSMDMRHAQTKAQSSSMAEKTYEKVAFSGCWISSDDSYGDETHGRLTR